MLSLFSFLTGGWRLVNFISIDGAQLTIYHYNHEIAQSELVYWFFSKNICKLNERPARRTLDSEVFFPTAPLSNL